MDISLPLPYLRERPVTDLKSLDWQRLIWKKIEKRVFNLQKRIYKATIIGQYSSHLRMVI
jgi:hypothetical protein